MSGRDDPFGREGEEQGDPFGRPAEEHAAAEQRDEETPLRGFLPPTDAPPLPAPAPPPAQPGGFLPPTDQPPEPDAWWAGPSAPAVERADGADHPAGRLAEWPQRALAAVIDFLVRFAAVLFVGTIVAMASGGSEDAVTVAIVAMFWFVTPLYAPVLMARWDGRTVGHRATQTRVVRSDGSRLEGGGAFVREVLVKHLLFDWVAIFVTLGIGTLINYLWPLWDERNEALHDKMCNTRVVRV